MSRHFLAFLSYPSNERRLLVETLIILSFVRIGLTAIPFRVFRNFLGKHSRVWASDGEMSPCKAVWAVKVVSSYVPAATCLTQALAAQVLLARCGHPTELRLGATKDTIGGLRTPAWLELHGRVIIGDAAESAT